MSLLTQTCFWLRTLSDWLNLGFIKKLSLQPVGVTSCIIVLLQCHIETVSVSLSIRFSVWEKKNNKTVLLHCKSYLILLFILLWFNLPASALCLFCQKEWSLLDCLSAAAGVLVIRTAMMKEARCGDIVSGQQWTTHWPDQEREGLSSRQHSTLLSECQLTHSVATICTFLINWFFPHLTHMILIQFYISSWNISYYAFKLHRPLLLRIDYDDIFIKSTYVMYGVCIEGGREGGREGGYVKVACRPAPSPPPPLNCCWLLAVVVTVRLQSASRCRVCSSHTSFSISTSF